MTTALDPTVDAGPADAAYLDRLAGVDFAPVFIMGDHRSGTTVLYQLLASTGAFTVVTAYDVVRRDHLLADHLTGRRDAARAEMASRFAALGLRDRGFDAVEVTPDLPEEYGFAIDDSPRPHLGPGSRDAFVTFCRKLRLVGGDRPILLKNPWDVLHFAYVKEAFPAARLVFVHRHPADIMSSQIHAIRVLMESRNEYVALLSASYRRLWENPVRRALARAALAPATGLLPRIVGRHVGLVVDYYQAHAPAMPAADVVSIRYEDLCADPDRAIAGVLGFLGLPERTGESFRGRVQPRRRPPSAEAAQEFARRRERLAAYCAAHGYPLDLETGAAG